LGIAVAGKDKVLQRAVYGLNPSTEEDFLGFLVRLSAEAQPSMMHWDALIVVSTERR